LARGPFQGTFSPNAQPTVVTAPDGLVFINGETDLLGCPSCKRKFDLNKYVTSIQVDLSVESVPGSASISLAIPRHTVDDFYVDGRTIISPMMEVELYAKGHFLVEGIPQYYPIFWGLVTEVSTDYSGGSHTVSINCADILKWWELCRMNINAAYTTPPGQLGRSIMGNVLFGKNPYDVIWLLAQQSFGDVMVATSSLNMATVENNQKETFSSALGSVMQYWTERFTKIRSNLLLYGTQGQAVRGDSLLATYGDKDGHAASTAVRTANGGADGAQLVFDPTGDNVVAFKTQFMEAGQINFWQSEYQTKLEIAQAAKDALGYEFYMDVTGDIVFKPPFYNLDVLSNKPLSWIQDIDIISMNLGESEAEVVTQLTLSGSYAGNIEYGLGEESAPQTSVTDYHLLRKYGWRQAPFNSEFLGNPHLMFYVGMDHLDKLNSRRHRASVTIPIRPELRLGFPIYLAPLDQVWYISGISHSLQFGSQATTTLTLTAKREKFLAPKGIGKLTVSNTGSGTIKSLQRSAGITLEVGEAAQIPPIKPQGPDSPYAPLVLRHPKTGRVMGYPNVVMAYTRPFANVSDKDLKYAAGQKDQKQKQLTKEQTVQRQKALEQGFTDGMQRAQTYQKMDETQEKHLSNRYQYGLNSAGVYVYAHDVGGQIQEMLLYPRNRLKVTNAPKDLISGVEKGSAFIRPVSDARGFEVIGHSRYGRGLSLRDGSLVLSQGAPNTRANVDMQVAISGSVWDQLTSQSVSIPLPGGQNPNPADTVNRLGPTDLDTAAVISPETKQPQIVPGTDTFVATAPLGATFEQSGMDLSVEAGQLSRALTLNEMGSKWGEVPGAASCSCASGRADLWFITQGLQVKPASGSATSGSPASEIAATHPDNVKRKQVVAVQKTVQDKLTAEVDAWPELEATINERAYALAKAANKGLESVSDFLAEATQAVRVERFTALYNDSYKQYMEEELAAQKVDLPPEVLAGLADPGSSQDPGVQLYEEGGALALQNMTQVESYLAQLYSALDAPHQEFERALRGELTSVPARNPIEVRFGTEPQQDGGLSPPFSPISRALGGDPAALAITANTAVKDIASTWNTFGQRLQNKAQRAKLTSEITGWSADLERLQKERDRLQKGVVPGGINTTVSVDSRFHTSLKGQIADLNKQILALNKQIAKNQQKLQEVP
jgi:hypothetical protein